MLGDACEHKQRNAMQKPPRLGGLRKRIALAFSMQKRCVRACAAVNAEQDTSNTMRHNAVYA